MPAPKALDATDFGIDYRRQITGCWDQLDMKELAAIADVLDRARKAGRFIYVMGNGGSASTASHLATDLSKTAAVRGAPAMKAVSLADNIAFVTAIGNDISYDAVFTRQMENILAKDDVVILISGSGNSPNILQAAEMANAKGAMTVGLVGFDGGKLKALCRHALHVESDQYGVVEDMHMSIGHMLTFFFKQKDQAASTR